MRRGGYGGEEMPDRDIMSWQWAYLPRHPATKNAKGTVGYSDGMCYTDLGAYRYCRYAVRMRMRW